MSDKGIFRKTQVSGGHKADAGQQNDDVTPFAGLEPRKQLERLLKTEIGAKPFSELSGVTFDHRAAVPIGHMLLDALEEQGYSIDDFDAVGALTAAAVPLIDSMIHAAASRGQDLDGFVMDFVYPSIKGPAISGKRVVLLDSWLSRKSFVQTSSLVTLRNGNELSLDLGVIAHENAEVVAIASLIGALAGSGIMQGSEDRRSIKVVNPITDEHQTIPFIQVFDERELR